MSRAIGLRSRSPVDQRVIFASHERLNMNEFDRAAENGRGGIVRELLYFFGQTKKWWLMPIVLVSLIFGGLMFLSSTAAAPFIYSLF